MDVRIDRSVKGFLFTCCLLVIPYFFAYRTGEERGSLLKQYKTLHLPYLTDLVFGTNPYIKQSIIGRI